MNREAIMEIIRGSSLSHRADELIPLLAPSIALNASRVELGELALGQSRVGGLPDLPAGTPWPENKGKKLAFLAQLRAADYVPYDADHALPGEGWLAFFYDAEKQPWGKDPADRGSWRVLYFSAEPNKLVRVSSQPDQSPGFSPCSIQCESSYRLPSSDVLESGYHVTLEDEESDAYNELLKSIDGASQKHGSHFALGHASDLQADVRLGCQLASHGWCWRYPEPFDAARHAELAPGAADWQLLLELNSHAEGPNWMWGDMGRLYFCIRRDDLNFRRFENVWTLLQCY